MFNDIKAVSIDDTRINLMLIEIMAKEIGLEIHSFLNPLDALEYIRNNRTDLLFVDYMMPKMDGVTLVKEVRTFLPDIPIIMISAVSDDLNELKLKAIKAGATEFLNKPLNIAEFTARVQNLATMRQYQLLLSDKAAFLEQEIQNATGELIRREHETLQTLSRAAEYKDPETGNHIARVAHYSQILVMAAGGTEAEQQLVFYAAPLHDIGKIGIPDSILLKPARLTTEEFNVMKTHAEIGYNIMSNAESQYLKAGATIALSHHEKYNGSGYPRGLTGEDIPFLGRVVAVADVFDALTSHRPYKKTWTFKEASDYLTEERGKHFDPKLIDLFTSNIEQIRKIYQRYSS